MSKSKSIISVAVGSAFAATLGFAPTVSAAENPFAITTVPLTFKVETSEYERCDTGYAGHLAIKPSNRAFQIN